VTDARANILGRIRRSLGRERPDPDTVARFEARLAEPRPNLVPARSRVPHAERVALFVAMAEAVDATVARVAGLDEVPAAVADYLAANNRPADVKMAPDPALDAIPWGDRPLLAIRRGRAEDEDRVGVTAAFAGIAETGTLMLISGPATPTTLNFMPETHVVVLRTSQIVGAYEEAWDRLRRLESLPRTVNFITGPSRTADIELTLYMGAHGPRCLHIVLVDDGEA